MKKALTARLERMERALAGRLDTKGVMSDEARAAAVDLIEQVITAELYAHACLRAMSLSETNANARPGGAVAPAAFPVFPLAVVDRFAELRALAGDAGEAWPARVDRLLDAARDMTRRQGLGADHLRRAEMLEKAVQAVRGRVA